MPKKKTVRPKQELYMFNVIINPGTKSECHLCKAGCGGRVLPLS